MAMTLSGPARYAATLLLAFAAAAFMARSASADSSRLTIFTRTGTHVFQVEEARTEAERERGLMNRGSLPSDKGMIFAFPTTMHVSFWMKNTLIPLDMLFVLSDGTVAGIVSNAKPMSEKIIPSPGPVRFVVELNGGQAARIGAKAGDRIENRLIR